VAKKKQDYGNCKCCGLLPIIVAIMRYVKQYGWVEQAIIQPIAVNSKNRKQKVKTEMLVANYHFHLAQNCSQLLF